MGGVPGYLPLAASAELYDLTAGTFAFTTSNMNIARELGLTATLLNSGTVFVAGGYNGQTVDLYLASAELYDRTAETFSFTGSLNYARRYHTATLLCTGKVLIVGGVNGTGILATAELY